MSNPFGGYMELGHDKTDKEHLLLFINVAQVSNATNKDDAIKALKELHSNFILHCANEEIYMRHTNNPLLNQHTIIHIALKDLITKYINRVGDYESHSYSYIANILDKELSVHLTDWDSKVFKKGYDYDDIESGFGL